MKLTKERKVFLGLLGAAGAALLIDQVMLAPSSASAGQAQPMPAIGADGPVGAAPDEGISVDSLAHIARRIRSFASTKGEVANAFDAPESWTAAAIAQRAETVEPARAAVAPELNLTAVLPSGTGGVAIINGISVRVGERVAGTGYRLVEVTSGLAVLSDGQRTHVLKMPHARHMMPKPPSTPAAREKGGGLRGMGQAAIHGKFQSPQEPQ